MERTASTNASEFERFVNATMQREDWPNQPAAWAVGIATVQRDTVLDVRFPYTNVGGENAKMAAFAWGNRDSEDTSRLVMTPGTLGLLSPILADGLPHPNVDAVNLVREHTTRGISDRYGRRKIAVLAWVQSFDTPPSNTVDVWLRLTLMSQRKILPNGMNLDGIFGILPNVVWTSEGPFLPEGFEDIMMRSYSGDRPPITVLGVDKFSNMLNYVVLPDVRIADGARVRLGAYLAPGTTVMHAGFVNFNAGTLGPCMVEGRISQGVLVGSGSDIGGGASTMGTLSGGGTERIRIGKGCLLGANSGIGISLGDNCIVEAGLYLTASMKVTVLPAKGESGKPRVVYARELSGVSGILFRRNSLTGSVEAIPTDVGIVLNSTLHN